MQKMPLNQRLYQIRVFILEKLRLRQQANAAEKLKANKKLTKKASDSNIPVNRLKKKKISMDEISIVTLDSKANQKHSPSNDKGNFIHFFFAVLSFALAEKEKQVLS